MKKAICLMILGMLLTVHAQAQELTVSSTAIVSNFGPACASKGTDTQSNINQVQSNIPALRGLIQQKSVVNSEILQVPPQTVYDPCIYQRQYCTWIGRYSSCVLQCVGGYVEHLGYTVTNYRCDTTLFLNTDAYALSLMHGDENALKAARAQGNVVYDELDHGKARWVSVNPN